MTSIDELRRAKRDPEPTEESQSEQVQYDLSRFGKVELEPSPRARQLGRFHGASVGR